MRLGVRGPWSVRQCLVLGRRLGFHVMSGVRRLLVQSSEARRCLGWAEGGLTRPSRSDWITGGRGGHEGTSTRKHHHKWESEKAALENASARLGFSRRSKVMGI